MQKLFFNNKEYLLHKKENGTYVIPFLNIPLIPYTKGVLEDHSGILIKKETDYFVVYRGHRRLTAALKLKEN